MAVNPPANPQSVNPQRVNPQPVNPYDETPYPDLTFLHTHPDRLATIATLVGMDPAPVEQCRVLEIGTASGANLISMAYGLPNSEFVGIDYALVQVERGRQFIQQLGLKNVEILHRDIMEVGEELGQFDYIISHGLYSWIPEAVRDRMMLLCKKLLRPQGVAYISYNTYPAWRFVEVIRDAMMYRVRDIREPRERVQAAVDFATLVANGAPRKDEGIATVFQNYLQLYSATMRAGNPAILLHDELSDINRPYYFAEFAAHAMHHGLQYLSEAELSSVFPHEIPAETTKQLQEIARNLIELEQYMDFVRNRMFRMTLLCHEDVTLNRSLNASRVELCAVTSRAATSGSPQEALGPGVMEFSGPSEISLKTDHPVSKVALHYLTEVFPRAVPYSELLAKAREIVAAGGMSPVEDIRKDSTLLATNLLRAFAYSSQLVGLHRYSPEVVTQAGERPKVLPPARLLFQQANIATNLWHERVELSLLNEFLFPLLDGTRTVDDLVEAVRASIRANDLQFKNDDGEVVEADDTEIEAEVKRHLGTLARASLLVA